MKKIFDFSGHYFPARLLPILAGLGASQVIGTIEVAVSNRHVFREMSAVAKSGYIPVPSPAVLATLTGVKAAVFGGVFFALSIGAGLTVLALGCRMIWEYAAGARRRWIGAVEILLWAAAIWFVVQDGWNPAAVFYVVLVPAAVLEVSRRGWGRHKPVAQSGQIREISEAAGVVIGLLPLILVIGLWVSQPGAKIFSDVRDRILFSNPVGTAVADFYYRYTLYPATAIKPFNMQTLRTCDLSAVKDHRLRGRIATRLRNMDCLDIGADPAATLRVSVDGDDLVFHLSGRVGLRIESRLFFLNPADVLNRLSTVADTSRPLRMTILFGLLVGLPVLLYLLGYVVIRWGFGSILQPRRACFAAGCACLGIGTFLFMRLASPDIGLGSTPVAVALRSSEPQIRIAALQQAMVRGENICRFGGVQASRQSDFAPERYWFARAVAGCPDNEAFPVLVGMRSDPRPIVACQAYWGLGQLGDRRAIPILLDELRKGRNWYVEVYAYRALRRLGWKQPFRSG